MSLIAQVTGTVAGKTLDQVAVQIGGIALAVAVPLPTLSQLTPNSTVTLYTHLIVREDDLALYGFHTLTERDLFVKLIGVSGVGPRLGMAMLSTLTPEAICRAILSEDADRLARTPGIGKKMAQRLVLELKAPITRFVAAQSLELGEIGQTGAGTSSAGAYENKEADVVDALTGLGYNASAVQAALRNIPDAATTPLDELIVKVLRVLAR